MEKLRGPVPAVIHHNTKVELASISWKWLMGPKEEITDDSSGRISGFSFDL